MSVARKLLWYSVSVVGLILTLTMVLAILGIPMLLYGVSKLAAGYTNS